MLLTFPQWFQSLSRPSSVSQERWNQIKGVAEQAWNAGALNEREHTNQQIAASVKPLKTVSKVSKDVEIDQ